MEISTQVCHALVLAKLDIIDCLPAVFGNAQDEDTSSVSIQSPVCRSTILPASGEDGTQLPVSVQPIRFYICLFIYLLFSLII